MKFENDNGALVCRHLGETVRIESWGKDALRVRASLSPRLYRKPLGADRTHRKMQRNRRH